MNEFTEALDRLLADASAPAEVRAIERGGAPDALWDRIEASGFLDAMVPEADGGAGLALRDAFALFVIEGRHATPVPLGHTMLARAILVGSGVKPPEGRIAIAPTARIAGDGAACRNVPHGLVADWVLASTDERWWLLPADAASREATGVHGSLRADLRWDTTTSARHTSTVSAAWTAAGAAIAAAQLAGALERVLEMTAKFANERVQFGRPIGKFQAIQHQLAVMAEQVAAARMAAQIGCASDGALPDPLRVAVAKGRASAASAIVAPIAHAIHGAIGITAELDLQLFTRRLHEGRADFGAESAWHARLGEALLAADAPAVDFMRAALLPNESNR